MWFYFLSQAHLLNSVTGILCLTLLPFCRKSIIYLLVLSLCKYNQQTQTCTHTRHTHTHSGGTTNRRQQQELRWILTGWVCSADTLLWGHSAAQLTGISVIDLFCFCKRAGALQVMDTWIKKPHGTIIPLYQVHEMIFIVIFKVTRRNSETVTITLIINFL